MTNGPHPSEDTPRSWGPLIGALAIAMMVIIGAIIWFFMGAPVSTDEQRAIEVCEALAADAGLPEIVRGDVSGPDGDGVIEVAWEFDDGTFGGCDATLTAGGGIDAELVGGAAPEED